MAVSKKKLIWIAIFIILIGFYKFFDPNISPYFLKCPFRSLTGLLCAGCGTQRAVQALLDFNLVGAFKFNPLLILSLPYLLLGFIIDLIDKPSKKIVAFRNRWYGNKAIHWVLTIVVIYWIGRNVV